MSRGKRGGRGAACAVVAAAAVVVGGCGGSASPDTPALKITGRALGLSVAPRNAEVLIETDRGIWRVTAKDDGRAARRIKAVFASRYGSVPIARLLSVAYAPPLMLGSSHPDRAHRGVPTNLGLLTSQDGGRTWVANSLYGKADLHLLQPTPKGLWALDIARKCLATTNDFGAHWSCRRLPGVLTGLAVDPRDANHAVVVTEHGLLETRNTGRSWRPAAFGDAEVVAWAPDGTLYGVARGSVQRAVAGDSAAGRDVGRLEGSILALASGGGRNLWALAKDGLLSRSNDGGRTWAVRAKLA